MKTNKKIILIGAGNLAFHLGKALKKSGYSIIQIYSRTKASAKLLAQEHKASFINDINKLSQEGDIYIMAVKDDKIDPLAKSIYLKDKILIHTSGSTELGIFKDCSSNYGVLYPLQTFSKKSRISFKNVPLCIEGNNKHSEFIIQQLANSISNHVISINTEKRKRIHLAAIFASNYSNHMYTIAENILKKDHLAFEILIPLIEETSKKIKHLSPRQAQTGPAVRGDKKTINKHLEMLSTDKITKQLYRIISKSIANSKP